MKLRIYYVDRIRQCYCFIIFVIIIIIIPVPIILALFQERQRLFFVHVALNGLSVHVVWKQCISWRLHQSKPGLIITTTLNSTDTVQLVAVPTSLLTLSRNIYATHFM